ncbi:hypothetical protein A8709_09305 [Paenibacillus pectinilyticus]|uniref:Uncharacterized protein n=1 Tax=Paenibacillus pectinilyticus TaxID=512399 RepID=A0A1C1A5H8_9BACL|nr:hypothetical protein [Paenibacillus pectinilyticus]OCT15816.1 hypothetical protein A8709_09305 [Paenibacillus pectinilyticus]
MIRKIALKVILLAIIATLFSPFLPQDKAEAAVHVKGYYRKNGTYVSPHYRSDPDGIKSNNWSYCGNINPYTGKVGSTDCGTASLGNTDTRSEGEKQADSYVWQAEYYSNQQNYYNALYYYGKVYETGYSYKISSQVSDIALKVSSEAYSLFIIDELTKSLQYYTLLRDCKASPNSLIENAKKNIEIVNEKLKFKSAFSEALWYFNQNDFLNAVLVANSKMVEGNTSTSALEFMKQSAEKLSEKAYSSFISGDYEYSLKCYTALSYLSFVPKELQANGLTNSKIVQSHINNK